MSGRRASSKPTPPRMTNNTAPVIANGSWPVPPKYTPAAIDSAASDRTAVTSGCGRLAGTHPLILVQCDRTAARPPARRRARSCSQAASRSCGRPGRTSRRRAAATPTRSTFGSAPAGGRPHAQRLPLRQRHRHGQLARGAAAALAESDRRGQLGRAAGRHFHFAAPQLRRPSSHRRSCSWRSTRTRRAACFQMSRRPSPS